MRRYKLKDYEEINEKKMLFDFLEIKKLTTEYLLWRDADLNEEMEGGK